MMIPVRTSPLYQGPPACPPWENPDTWRILYGDPAYWITTDRPTGGPMLTEALRLARKMEPGTEHRVPRWNTPNPLPKLNR